jgi:hypothetical protein
MQRELVKTSGRDLRRGRRSFDWGGACQRLSSAREVGDVGGSTCAV